jgi:hypothetical protein
MVRYDNFSYINFIDVIKKGVFIDIKVLIFLYD